MLVVVVLLLAGLTAAGVVVYRTTYSPTAFVVRYLDLLAAGRAADALQLPGVDPGDSAASAALLRHAALTTLTDIDPVAEEADGDTTRVTVSYRAGDVEGRTTFEVAQDGWLGVVPSWRFERSPLAQVDLSVRGSMSFSVNGFEVDKRQVSADGAAADPLAPVPLLVFSPGLYAIGVDTAIAATPGVAVLADVPTAAIPVDIQADATPDFVATVQTKVEEFLAGCASQQVLQPTGCPFGLQVRNRIVGLPAWSIASQPQVAVEPDGAGWRILPADAVAHVDVQIRMLYDGTLRDLSEDVPFRIEGTIEVLPDGSVSISVSGGNL